MIVPEFEIKDILKKYGLKTPYGKIIESAKEYDGKYPVVLKVSSKTITHKTESGAVILDIKSPEELDRKIADLSQKFPGEDLYVEEMEPRGIEVIVGLVNDQSIGKVMMLGIGGFYAELIKDVTFKKLPIDKYDAEDMLEELKYSNIFNGYRNLRCNKEILKDLLLKISKLGMEMEFQQMDFNPIFLYEDRYVIIDSKMVIL